MKKLLFVCEHNFVVFFIVIFSLFYIYERLSYGKQARGVTEDIISVGVFVDQTGPAASVGIPATEGTMMYLREINAMGGINGRRLKVLLEDDHYSIPAAISIFKKFVFKDRVLSILLGGGTGQTVVLNRHIEKEKVPYMTASLAESMTTPVKRYIFTPTASYDDGIYVIIDYIMNDLKAKNPKIAIVYPDNEFGKTGLRAAEKYLRKYNSKLASREILAFGAIDATSQTLSLKRSMPEYIILHNGASPVICLLRDAKKYGLKSKVFGSFYVSNEDTITIAGGASEGLVAVSPLGYWPDDLRGMNKLRKITEKYQPNTKPKDRNFTQGWIISMIFAEGVKRAGRDLTPDSLVEALESFKSFSTGDISGPVSYSKRNHKGGRANKLYKADVAKQRFIAISDFREPVFKDE